MQLIDSPDRFSTALQDDDLAFIWPDSSADDAVRRTLASVLLDDPDHRLRVAHLEALLQLRLPAHTGYTSGLGLQTLLLRDDATAAIFQVDFDNTRVTDWRGRVVHLDVQHLAKELAAARQHGQQQQHGKDLGIANGSSTQTPNGISSVPIPERSFPGLFVEQQAAAGTGGSSSDQQQQISPLSSSLGRQQPYTLDHIWGASPVFGAGGSMGHSGGVVEPPSGRASAPGARSSSSMSGAVGAGSAAAADQSRVSLFGSSFEVPHAIASCWAAPSSCGSGVGSIGRRHSQGENPSGPTPAGGLATVLNQAAKTPGGGILDQIDQDRGGSSTTSGSSSRSISAATRAATAAASRLRKTSDSALGFEVVGSKGPGKVEGASVAGSAGALSGCLDVSTPKSCGGVEASASPVTSGSGEDETEYNEAQLLFGVPGLGARGPAAAGADGGNGSGPAAAGNNSSGTRSTTAAAPAGDSEASPISCGVDWSRIAALHGQQQQLAVTAGGYDSPLHSSSVPGAQPPLLFGVDDVSSNAAAVTAQLMQQQLAMLGAQLSHPSQNMGDHSNGLLNPTTALGGSLFATAATGLSVGSNPAARGMLLQQQLNGNPGAAAAAGGAGGGGLSFLGAAATAAQLAESVLHDLDASGFGAQSSYPNTQQHQMQMPFAGSGTLHSSSYGSAVHSDRSSSGQWGASPVAGYGAAQQQQQHRPQQQQQQHRGSDNNGDIATRTDQLRQDSSAPTRPPAAAGPGKQAETFAAVAAARDKPPATAVGSGNAAAAAATAPRLTGWASVAARDPKATLTSPAGTPSAAAAASNGVREFGNASAAANGMRQQQQNVGGKLSGGPLSRLPAAVRSEMQALIAQFTGVLKVDDFDDGVIHQLNAKRSEEEAIAAVRHIAHYDLANIQHMAAYLNHLVKHYNHSAAAAAAAAEGAGSGGFTAAGGGSGGAQPGLGPAAPGANGAAGTQLLLNQSGSTLGSTLSGPGNRSSGGGVVVGASSAAAGGGGGNLGAYGGQIRLASVPVSTKAMLQKLPLKVFKQLEQLVGSCAYLEWRHFDAGVVKVLAQLSKLCEGDVFEELELLAATDLSNVEYMPAYLNKRLNNKLWSRRKADGHVNSNNS